MFTGIIEETGKIVSFIKSGDSAKIRIECAKVLEGANLGDSIAVNGVCLTAAAFGKKYFDADLSYETVAKTSLKNCPPGQAVNLERALTLSGRLGGHLVQGHANGTATIASVIKKSGSYVLKVNYPPFLDKYIAEEGSVALDGISLTCLNVKNNSLEVAVIPHTFESTNLKYKRSGDILNIETDMMSRYAEKLLAVSSKECGLKKAIR